jgi:hypothetical protein
MRCSEWGTSFFVKDPSTDLQWCTSIYGLEVFLARL